MADDFPVPNLDGAIDKLIEGLTDPAKIQRLERAIGNAIAYGTTAAQGASVAAVDQTFKDVGDIAQKVEDTVRGASAFVLAQMVAHMLGVDVPPSALRGAFEGGAESVVGKAIGTVVLSALHGAGGELKPGEAGSVKLVGMLSQLAVQAWFEGSLASWGLSLGGILNPISSFADLGHDIIEATGLDNLGRLALRPLVEITAATPLEWQANKTYRPKLLGASDTVRQVLRGRWTREQANEELARQGYSDERIEALFNAAAKFVGVDDALLLAREGSKTDTWVFDNLREQGYDEATAADVVNAIQMRRLVAIHDDSLAAIKRAYANREITDSEFTQFLPAIISDPAERAAVEVAAQTVRELNRRFLTPDEVAAMVRAGILAFADYRQTLRREGYDEGDVLSLELLLRWELDKERKVEEHRTQLEAERAAEQHARDVAAAAKKTAVDAERALHRRGALADLNRAVVRGLIPIARLEDVLRAQYDADTVAILVGLVEADRQTSLAEQRKREAAVQRGARRQVSVADLEAAVLSHVLTIDQYRASLEPLGFDAGDVDVLTRTLAARVRDRDAATQAHREATATAARRSIDLGRFERLVRRGVRTLPDYTTLLASLHFDEPAIAAMVELLELEIADDRQADHVRTTGEARLQEKGLSLEQLRRLVVLGLAPTADYEKLLITEGFTADAQVLLMNELRLAVADAEAARQRRSQVTAPADARALPLTTVARAARLGFVSPATYADRLVRAGWSADDIAIEMTLLLAEIADVQAARTVRDTTIVPIGDKGLSLTELAGAVKRGLKSLEAFRARAVELGLTKDAVDTQVRILGDELRETALAKARRTTIDAELKDRNVSLAELEQAVVAGTLTIDGFIEQLTLNGLTKDDAELLGAVLLDALEAPAG